MTLDHSNHNRFIEDEGRFLTGDQWRLTYNLQIQNIVSSIGHRPEEEEEEEGKEKHLNGFSSHEE